MLGRLRAWWRQVRHLECIKCNSALELPHPNLVPGYCNTCHKVTPTWWERFRGRDKCNKCNTELEMGRCFPCNAYPYKQWINEEECMILDDEDFRRERPQEYEDMERRNRKRTIKYLLTTDRKCYGEDEVKEVVQEMQNEKEVK